jgi:aryl-alcohol dehydrogenase-like predicted oxidoreductase
LCEQHGIVFLPWGPLQAGDATAVAEVATELGVTRSQVALAWLLYRSPLMLPIPGTSSIAHLEENFEASGVRVSDAQFARLQAQASGC